MNDEQFKEFMKYFKRATYALEVIASRELPEDNGKDTQSLFGNSFGQCRDCGTQLVDWIHSEENACDVCDGFIRDADLERAPK